MKKSNIIFGSLLSMLGVLYGLSVLGVIGDSVFSIAFVALIIVVPALTEHFNENSTKEYVVKGIFAGCLLLAMFVDGGFVFELVLAGIIFLSGIILACSEVIKRKLFKK